MWASALDYNFSPSAYSPAAANSTSSSFFGSSFSDNELKMNDSNFSQFQHQLAMSLTSGFPFISQGISSSSGSSSTDSTPHVRAKKKPNPVPSDKKTKAYWDRRIKNNASAQKSRNERRRREQENASRIGQLEQENHVLRTLNQQLQHELSCRTLQLQNFQQQRISSALNANEASPTTNAQTAALQQASLQNFKTGGVRPAQPSQFGQMPMNAYE